MTIWQVHGGNRLQGSIPVQGAKNAILPILAATLINRGISVIKNCPELSDVSASLEILSALGCSVMQNGGEIVVDSSEMHCTAVPRELMVRMRSSIVFLGAILARCGEVRLSAPGGCELGSRPIDLHLDALRTLGAEILQEDGELCCCAPCLKGAEIRLAFPSVGATENVLLAACCAEGETILRNAAREPEICDLAAFLNLCGAKIKGAGTSEIHIFGMKEPARYLEHRLLPDRIAASTYLCAAAACGGEILLTNVIPQHFSTVSDTLRSMGCRITESESSVHLYSTGNLSAALPVDTKPYPDFPTDAQAVMMASALKAGGTTVFRENIFESRFHHVPEMRKMGADISVCRTTAAVRGVRRLNGCTVRAADLRGGAALILAGLIAEGETTVVDPGYVLRGYERFDVCLRALGADVVMQSAASGRETGDDPKNTTKEVC